jgi:hypothetical protein
MRREILIAYGALKKKKLAVVAATAYHLLLLAMHLKIGTAVPSFSHSLEY